MTRPLHHAIRARGYPAGRSIRAGVASPSAASARASHVGASVQVTGEAPATRHAREPIEMSAETRELLQRGKLEQMCPDCGRWSAATHYCSWCFRPMTPADWYRNGDKDQRAARMPKSAPANPPSEYRHRASTWPKAWGKWPGMPRQDAPRPVQTLDDPSREPNRVVPAIQPVSPSSARRSGLPPLLISSGPSGSAALPATGIPAATVRTTASFRSFDPTPSRSQRQGASVNRHANHREEAR